MTPILAESSACMLATSLTTSTVEATTWGTCARSAVRVTRARKIAPRLRRIVSDSLDTSDVRTSTINKKR